MSLTTVAELRSALGIGSLYSDSTLQEAVDAADEVLTPMLWQNHYYNTSHGISSNVATLYFNENIYDAFYVGQSVTVTENTATFNGAKTLTAVTDHSISYALTSADQAVHRVQPFGQVAVTTKDYSTDNAVQEAALMISVDIWQARQTTSSGGVAVDFQPGPWKMSSSLIARIRGLIAHALSPNSMVG